jgi:hypothetical protein
LPQAYLAQTQLHENEHRMSRAGYLGASAVNPLRFGVQETRRCDAKVHLLKACTEAMRAQWGVDVERQEAVADRIDPIGQRAALIDILGGPATRRSVFGDLRHRSTLVRVACGHAAATRVLAQSLSEAGRRQDASPSPNGI